MFCALKQGSTVFVLDKSNKPTIKVGTIVSTTQPTSFAPYMQNVPGQTIDVVVKFDDGTTNEFKQLMSNMSVATYGNVIVAETSELMLHEVDNMERVSRQVLDTIPYHQSVVDSISEIKAVLSPSFKKEQETDKRLTSLEHGLGDIKEMLVKMSQSSSLSSNKH